MNSFSIKTKIYFERHSIQYLKSIDKERAFIITDPFMVQSKAIDKILNIIKEKNIAYEVFSDIKPDPPIEIVAKGIKKMQNFRPDIVISLGGGSAIDAAKSILMFTGTMLNMEKDKYEKPIFVAIPTTSGTGSEVTAFSVISNKHKKFPLFHQELVPDVAIIDIDFVKTAPPRITADTALDALTHAIEAYVSKKASDYTDALAEKAIKNIFEYIVIAYKNGEDLYAREKLHNASCMAGIAFTNASLGLNHSMAHALGSMYNIPHGRANAILLPYVIKYNSKSQDYKKNEAALKYAQLSQILGIASHDIEESVDNLIKSLRSLLRDTDTPMTLKEIYVDKKHLYDNINKMVEDTLADPCTKTNPKVPIKDDLINLFKEVYEW